MTEQTQQTEKNPSAAAETVAGLPPTAAPDAAYVEKMTSAKHGDPVPADVAAKAAADAARPADIPEQFWDPATKSVRTDELVKSYAALRAKMDGKAPDAPADDKAQTGDDDKAGLKIEKPGDKAKEGEGEAPPLTTAVQSLAKAFEETGEFPEENVKALVDLGLPAETIEIYRAGLEALTERAVSEVHTVAGGKDKYEAAVEWARQNLNDKDLAYYNGNIDDPAKRTQTVEWLMGKFSTARPSEGKLVGGLAPTASSGDVFSSDTQVTQAMSDPRYKTDPAYRKQVAEKMLRSRQAGTLASNTEFFTRT